MPPKNPKTPLQTELDCARNRLAQISAEISDKSALHAQKLGAYHNACAVRNSGADSLALRMAGGSDQALTLVHDEITSLDLSMQRLRDDKHHAEKRVDDLERWASADSEMAQALADLARLNDERTRQALTIVQLAELVDTNRAKLAELQQQRIQQTQAWAAAKVDAQLNGTTPPEYPAELRKIESAISELGIFLGGAESRIQSTSSAVDSVEPQIQAARRRYFNARFHKAHAALDAAKQELMALVVEYMAAGNNTDFNTGSVIEIRPDDAAVEYATLKISQEIPQ